MFWTPPANRLTLHDAMPHTLRHYIQFDVLSVSSFNYWDERALFTGDGNGEQDEAPPAVERVPSNQVCY